MLIKICSSVLRNPTNTIVGSLTRRQIMQISTTSSSSSHLVLPYNSSQHTIPSPQRKTKITKQQFSTKNSPTPRVTQSNPAYTLFQNDLVFTLKFLPPSFKKTMNSNICVDRKGKIQFGFTPRVEDSTMINWPATSNVILGVEDVGTLLYNISNADNSVFNFTTPYGDILFKFILPVDEDVSDTITISLEKDGACNEVVLNTGEFEVIKTFLSRSIPQLVGWDSLTHHSVINMFEGRSRNDGSEDPYAR